jgi:hypothetical protein
MEKKYQKKPQENASSALQASSPKGEENRMLSICLFS